MKIFQINDGSMHCCVIAKTKENALNLEEVKEYFCDTEPCQLWAEELDGKISHTINFEGTRITHTIAEWEYIFQRCDEMIISQSEY